MVMTTRFKLSERQQKVLIWGAYIAANMFLFWLEDVIVSPYNGFVHTVEIFFWMGYDRYITKRWYAGKFWDSVPPVTLAVFVASFLYNWYMIYIVGV